MIHRTFWLAMALLLSLIPWTQNIARAQGGEGSLYARAQDEFSRRLYSKSLLSFRDYLRKNPGDQDAWTRFAAAYYHTGQAEQALKYLRKSRVSPSLKVFNLYYQGLSYDALGDVQRARKLLNRVSRSDDPLADDALFEKAAIDFAEGDAGAAKVSLEDYRRRYRNGSYRTAVDLMLQRLNQAGSLEISESQRSRYRSSFFLSNPLSLMSLPHAWLYQVGYDWEAGERVSPNSNPEQAPRAKPYSQQTIVAKAGLNLGPFHWQGSSHTFGYLYSQNWLSDSDRLNVYAENIGDLEYFPFRPDLMERSNRLLMASSVGLKSFEVGAYAHFELLKGGSSIYPAPEREEIRKVFDIGNSMMFIPWLGWRLTPQHSLKGSMIFEKFLDAEQADFSYKTYNFSQGASLPSITVQLQSDWTIYKLESQAEFFRWSYVYNDYWEGYTTTGGSLGISFQPLAMPIFVGGRMTIAQREFTSDLIKSTPCAGGEGPPTTCPRSELYTKFGGSLSYIRDKQQAFSVFFDYSQLKNDTLTVYNESAFDLFFALTHAFPSLKSGARFIEPPRGLHLSRGY